MIEDFNCILYAPPYWCSLSRGRIHFSFLEDNDFVESFKKHSMYLKQFVKHNKDHLSGLYTLQGLRHFVDTGYTIDFLQPFYQPLTINDRIKILRRLKNFINTYSINLVDVLNMIICLSQL